MRGNAGGEMMQTMLSIDLVASDSQVRGGRPCIAGTGIRVTDVVMANLFHRRQPDEIAADYELSLAQVYAALSYYYEHKVGLDADIRVQVELARSLKEQGVGRQGSLLS